MKRYRDFLRSKKLAMLAASLSIALAGLMSPGVAQAAPGLSVTEGNLCRQINTYRASKGLPPLKVSPKLNAASDWHTNDMATENYFSHTDSLGRDPFQRMAAFGYTYSTYKGENIAAGNAGSTATLTQWKNSPPHKANLLNANYKVMGIARNNNPSSTYNYYWNNTFGGFVDPGAFNCPAPTATAGSSVDDPVAVESSSPDAASAPVVTPVVGEGASRNP